MKVVGGGRGRKREKMRSYHTVKWPWSSNRGASPFLRSCTTIAVSKEEDSRRCSLGENSRALIALACASLAVHTLAPPLALKSLKWMSRSFPALPNSLVFLQRTDLTTLECASAIILTHSILLSLKTASPIEQSFDPVIIFQTHGEKEQGFRIFE